jgi:hypothetical protein
MFTLILIYMIVKYLTTLLPEQSKALAAVGLILTLLWCVLHPSSLELR